MFVCRAAQLEIPQNRGGFKGGGGLGGARGEVPENGFYDLFLFFKNLPAVQRIWPQQRLFSALGELGKSIWTTKKKSSKFSKTF